MSSSHLERFLKRENMGKKRPIPIERPHVVVIESSDKVEKISIGAHSNGVVFLTLLSRRPDGSYEPLRNWRRELPLRNFLNVVCRKARVFLQVREDQRVKEAKRAS